MKYALEWLCFTALALVIPSIIVVMVLWGDNQPQEVKVIPPVTVEVRELRCQEDEDIVTTLAANGLPVAYCQQVEER